MPKVAILHHNDGDGIGSAMIVAFAKKLNKDEVLFHGITYGQPVPHDKLKDANEIYIVDFSIQPAEEMRDFCEKYDGKVTWIDHHETSIDASKEFKEIRTVPGVRESTPEKAACLLTWEFFFQDQKPPKVIKYLSKYDVWQDENKDEWENLTMPIQMLQRAKLHDTDKSYYLWMSLLGEGGDEELMKLLDMGRAIYDYTKIDNKLKAKAHVFRGTFAGHTALIANVRGSTQFFDSVINKFEPTEVLVLFALFKEGFWTTSIYKGKAGGVHCGELAKKLGAEGPKKSGGGHADAAGFQATWEQLDRYIVRDDDKNAVWTRLADKVKD